MTLLYPLDADLDRNVRLQLLGTKAAGLHEMTALGIPVPPGFTITTEVGAAFRESGHWPAGLEAAIESAIESIEESTGKRFGSISSPLLLSVRSGAQVSMPGMMDTVLNVGLNEDTLAGLAAYHADERFALDAYRRLLQMYGSIVRDIPSDRFQFRLDAVKRELDKRRIADSELDPAILRRLVDDYKTLIEEASGTPFPMDVRTQLWDAVKAVFASWNNARAVRYRRMQGIQGVIGTACTVQAMVFGNTGPRSGSGVAFTRNPSNGDRQLYGEFLANAQGEDVVAGLRTPVPLTDAASLPGREASTLQSTMPDAFGEVVAHCTTLERHFRDMQDVEFTIENGTAYILQTRSAKRTARAAVRIAVDMVREGVLSHEEALLRVDARSLEQLLHARLPSATDLAARGIQPAAVGLPASPGAASGRIVFDADDAVRWVAEGQDVILVRQETSAEDIHGMRVAKGVVTAAGGMTSHAAVVARGLGKCAVVGCGGLRVDFRKRTVQIDDAPPEIEALQEGDVLTLDGSTGRIYTGALDLEASSTVEELGELMRWADDARRMRVYAEADTPQTARAALSYGAEGVGLCRTERMFFAPDRLFAMQCALLAMEDDDRNYWLGQLETAQREDFSEIFEAMSGRPVTIRLLDRALEEVMPVDSETLGAIGEALDLDAEELERAVDRYLETNPAFGHRGVRAGVTVPGLYDMQISAMLTAARQCVERGTDVELEILVPMVAWTSEVVNIAGAVDRLMARVFDEPHPGFACRLGTMLELPSACLSAGELAEHVDFFSFGSNDLTQTVLGMSREDAVRFLPPYRNELGLVAGDPFTVLDSQVLEMMRIALERGRCGHPRMITGLCGDQGGNPETIEACERLGLDFVCAPLSLLPGARLAAAQATLKT